MKRTLGITPAALAAVAAGDLHNAMIATMPGGIEAQESAGQAMLVAAEQLPKECTGATREQLVALGFWFGADVDEIFVTARLPPGWQKVAGENAYWSRIYDEKGRERASIFYKAAFYDRRAHMSMSRRYSVGSYFDHPTDPKRHQTQVLDGQRVIRVIGDSDRQAGYEVQSAHEEAGRIWLEDNFPRFRDPLAYWDQP